MACTRRSRSANSGPRSVGERLESVRHKLKASLCEAQPLDLLRSDSAYSSSLRRTVKGKPVERRGRKATGLRVARSDHDSGVARMYNTNIRFYVHLLDAIRWTAAARAWDADRVVWSYRARVDRWTRGHDRMNVIVFSKRHGRARQFELGRPLAMTVTHRSDRDQFSAACCSPASARPQRLRDRARGADGRMGRQARGAARAGRSQRGANCRSASMRSPAASAR